VQPFRVAFLVAAQVDAAQVDAAQAMAARSAKLLPTGSESGLEWPEQRAAAAELGWLATFVERWNGD